jgi:hypothetical protein
MVYKTHLDYHMATPNLPEIKSYIDTAGAQKFLSQIGDRLTQDASPFADIPQYAEFGSDDQPRRDQPLVRGSSFSWKTTVLCFLFFGFVAFLYYLYNQQTQWTISSSGYEQVPVLNRFKIEQHLNAAGEYVKNFAGRIMDMDETVLSPT